MDSEDPREKVIKKVEELTEELVPLTIELGNARTPRGNERPGGEIVLNWYKKNNIKFHTQEVYNENSFNVIGMLEGTGESKSLMFNAHLDSSGRNQYAEAWLDGEFIVGKNVVNDKGCMAAFMIAAKALKESEVELKGDVILLSAVGETGGSPIDEYNGIENEGEGFGTWIAVNRGVISDYAIVAETTDFTIGPAESGDTFFKIRVSRTGDEPYLPRVSLSSREVPITEHHNPIVKGASLVLGLEDWCKEYERKSIFNFRYGKIVPKAAVGAIRAGDIRDPGHIPESCDIYLDVRLPPDFNPTGLKIQICNEIKKLGFEAEVSMYRWRRGYVAKNIEPLIKAVEKAHEYILYEKSKEPPEEIMSMWRDHNILNEVGIPSLTYGPTRIEYKKGERKRAIRIKDLVNCAKIYALIALDICNQKR